MGKRRHKYEDQERIRRKIRRLERRLEYSSSGDEDYNSDYADSHMRSLVTIPSKPDEAQDVFMESEPLEPDLYETEPCEPDFEIQDNITPNTLSKPNDVEPETPSLSVDILEALGESKDKLEIFAPKIREEISERWGRILVDGLSKESVRALNEKINIPENFKFLKAPLLNPEIASVLSDSTKKRDKRLENSQNHLGKSIAAISTLVSTLISGDLDKTDLIKKLSEAGQLLLDLHHQNTWARRKLITFSLDKKFLDMVQTVKRDSFLFGENLGEKIKASKTAEKSGLQVKRTFEPQPSTSTAPYRTYPSAGRQGNLRGPPRTQALRGKRGGPRIHASSRPYRRPPATTATDRYANPPKSNNNRPVRKS